MISAEVAKCKENLGPFLKEIALKLESIITTRIHSVVLHPPEERDYYFSLIVMFQRADGEGLDGVRLEVPGDNERKIENLAWNWNPMTCEFMTGVDHDVEILVEDLDQLLDGPKDTPYVSTHAWEFDLFG